MFRNIIVLLMLALWISPAFSQEKQDIRVQVLQLNLKSLEDKAIQVKTDGVIVNNGSRTIQNISVNIHLMKKVQDSYISLRTYTLPSIYRLTPKQKETFSVNWVFKDHSLNSSDLVSLRAVAQVNTFSSLPTLQIVDWVLEENWKEINSWSIPITQSDVNSKKSQIETSLKYLLTIPTSSPDYDEAIRKWNLIQFNYGKELEASNQYHQAILQYGKVEPDSIYYQTAVKHIRQLKPAAMYYQAIKKFNSGYIREAFLQLNLIPKSSPYAPLAKDKLKEWRENGIFFDAFLDPLQFKDRIDLWNNLGVSYDEETLTTHSRYKAITRWFLNYDSFTSDDTGNHLYSLIHPIL